ALREGVREQVLELASLVAAVGEARADVVALRPDLRAREVLGQPLERMDRRRPEQQRVAVEAVERARHAVTLRAPGRESPPCERAGKSSSRTTRLAGSRGTFKSVTRQRLWSLARTRWFDGLVEAVLTQDVEDGPVGPVWFDVLAILGITLPLLARRRFRFGSMAVSGVVFAASSFVDDRLIPHGVVPFLTAIAVFVLFGLLRDRTQAVAGLGVGLGVTAIILRNDPKGSAAGFGFTALVFSLAWTVAFAIGRKLQEADEVKERLARAERERLERARAAVEEERARIARELHDVVGHS